MDFSGMLSGGSAAGSGSGIDIGSLLSGLSGLAGSTGGMGAPVSATGSGGAAGNSLGSTLGGVGGAAIGTALLPGIGTALGGSLGSMLGGLMGKPHVPDGAGKFAGLHSPTLDPIDDSTWFKEDCDIFIGYAQALGISVEEVGMGMAYDCDRDSSFKPGGIFDAWREVNPANAKKWIDYGNQRNPGALITYGQKGPLRLSVSSVRALTNMKGAPSIIDLASKLTSIGNGYEQGVPLGTSIYTNQAAQYPQGVPLGTSIQTVGNSLTSQPLGSTFNAAASASADKGTLFDQLIKAMAQGAQSGAVDVLADTDAAKAAKADYFKQFVADYQLPLAAGGIGLLLVIKKAFFDHNA